MLTVAKLVKSGLQKAFAYYIYLMINLLFWILTVWIPYVNIGTTLGLFGIIAKMSRDEKIGFFELFNPVYRKRPVNFQVILFSFLGGILIALCLLFIPVLLIFLPLGISLLLAADQGLKMQDALKQGSAIARGKLGIFYTGSILALLIVGAFSSLPFLYTYFIYGPMILLLTLPLYSCLTSSTVFGLIASAYELRGK